MKSLKALLIGLPFIFATSLTLHAYNFSFMENSPAFYFEGDDVEIMEHAADKALDSGPAEKKVSWENPATTARGYFIASKPYRQNGYYCRNLKSFTDVDGVKNEAIYRFCKIQNEWRIVD